MLNGDENVGGERSSVCGLVQNLQNVHLDAQNKQEHGATHTESSINDIDNGIGKHYSMLLFFFSWMLKICERLDSLVLIVHVVNSAIQQVLKIPEFTHNTYLKVHLLQLTS